MPNREKELVKEYKANSTTTFGVSQEFVEKMESKTRSMQYDEVIVEAKHIFTDRNTMYKDAFTALGLIGTVTTLIGDTFRLKYMIYDSDDYGRKYKEQIRDKLLDIINQAVISIFVLDDNNFKGK